MFLTTRSKSNEPNKKKLKIRAKNQKKKQICQIISMKGKLEEVQCQKNREKRQIQ